MNLLLDWQDNLLKSQMTEGLTKTMKIKKVIDGKKIVSNSSNKVSARCMSCKSLDKDFSRCMKSGTCIYDLAAIAKTVSK